MSNSNDTADPRRFKLLPVDQLTPEQRKLYDAIRSGPRARIANSGAASAGPLGGPFNVWLRSPGIGDCVQRLGEEIRFRSSLPAKLNELAICVTARFWTSQYEWHAHCRLALEAGLDPAIAQDIAAGKRPAKMDADEALVFDFSTELHEQQSVCDANYKRALDRFGERGVFDLIAVNGFYSLVSMCLNVDRTPLPAGTPLPLTPRAASSAGIDCMAVVNGLRIHYVDWGRPGDTRQPLVLLHGIGRIARSFDPIVPRFSDRYRVIAIDMRGHGDSDWHPGAEYIVEDYVKDVVALIERLDLRDIVLWGNSTGGRVAQIIAGTHSERTAGVIVEDVGPERPKEISARRGSRMAREQEGWATLEDLVAQSKTEYPRTPESTLRHIAIHNSKPRADGRLVLKRDPDIEKGFVPTEIWRFVKTIRVPIIYILGGASTIVPAETQEELKRTLPHVEIVTMPGLGHYPNEEDPAGFAAIAHRFLAQLSSRS